MLKFRVPYDEIVLFMGKERKGLMADNWQHNFKSHRETILRKNLSFQLYI